MDRSHTGPLRSRHGSDIGSSASAESSPSNDQRSRRRVSYGLGLLLLALSVGLAAALILTIGTANADGALEAECSNRAVFVTGAKSDGPAPRCAATPLSPAQCLHDGRTVARGNEPKSEPAEIGWPNSA